MRKTIEKTRWTCNEQTTGIRWVFWQLILGQARRGKKTPGNHHSLTRGGGNQTIATPSPFDNANDRFCFTFFKYLLKTIPVLWCPSLERWLTKLFYSCQSDRCTAMGSVGKFAMRSHIVMWTLGQTNKKEEVALTSSATLLCLCAF